MPALKFSDGQKDTLLKLARKVVEAQVTRKEISGVEPCNDPALSQPCGCFVTLHVDGLLRGCIGTFQASSPLWKTVIEIAKASLDDPRFRGRPVLPSELGRLEIEISVLSVLEKTDDPLSLELGVHGIYISRDYHTGCFLPQVATEAGWSKEEFLSYCCSHKAGLPEDAWGDPKTDVYLFTAEVFSEKQLAGQRKSTAPVEDKKS